MKLFHIVDRKDWAAHVVDGFYSPPSLAKEGFIHFSTEEQVEPTANLYFKGKRDLLLLEITLPASDPNLKFEAAAGPGNREGSFPHYYSKLSLSFVTAIFQIDADAETRKILK